MYKGSVYFILQLLTPSLLCVSCFTTLVLGSSQLSEGVNNVLSFVQDTLGNIQKYVGEQNGCRYTCPNGSVPKINPHHKKSANGCGAFGYQLEKYLSFEKLTECCNKHDVCYDTCNQSKKTCDNAFKVCLEGLCHQIKRVVSKDIYEACKCAADMMFAGTVALGCKPYKDAQEKACMCERPRKPHIEL